MSSPTSPRTPAARLAEEELVARAASGDRAAFRSLYEQLAPRVRWQVIRMIGPGPDVDDFMQEAFVQIHRSLGSWRSEARLSTWVWRIVHHATVDGLRRRRRPVNLAALQVLQGGPETWGRLDARARLRLLYELLETFPVEQREAFVLFEFEGMSMQEIAEEQGVPLQTSAARIRRTRERLRELLDDEESGQALRRGGNP